MQVDLSGVAVGGLGGGEYDVVIIGQDDDVGGADGEGGVDYLAGAGVERLTTGNYGGAAGVLEQIGQALARSHRNHRYAGADFSRQGTLPVAGGPVPVLQAHVVDLDFIQLSVADAQGQGGAGVFGMHMDPRRRATANYDC